MFNKNKKLFQYLSIPLFIGLMSFVFSWQGALLLFFAVYTHEHGHLYFSRQRGIATYGIFMIPFIGGVAFVDDERAPIQHTFEGLIGGPLVTFLELLISLYCYWFSDHQPFFTVSTTLFAGMLLLNLAPIYKLDGGQLFDMYITTLRIRFALLVRVLLAVSTALYFQVPLLAIIGIMAVMEALSIFKKRQDFFGDRVSRLQLVANPLRNKQKLPRRTVMIAMTIHLAVLAFAAWVFGTFISDPETSNIYMRFFGL